MKSNGKFVVLSGGDTIGADNVMVAMATYLSPRVPQFARELHPDGVQLHSLEYRSPPQLRRAAFSSLGLETQEPRSPPKFHKRTKHGYPDGKSGTNRLADCISPHLVLLFCVSFADATFPNDHAQGLFPFAEISFPATRRNRNL